MSYTPPEEICSWIETDLLSAIPVDLIPENDGAFDLGSSSKRWKQAYLSEMLDIEKDEAGYGIKMILTSASDANSSGILSSITSGVARTSGYVQGIEVTLTPHASDTVDAAYAGIRINDISADGSADKVAIDIAGGWVEAILMQSGNILFEDYSAKIYTERSTNGDGYDLAIAGCDGSDSGAGDRAGGDLLLYGGDPANAGAEGNVILCYDGANPRGKIGVGTPTVDSSAIFDIVSTTKGFLPPRMTEAQRDAIASPAEGLFLHDTDDHKLNIYNGTEWRGLVTAAAGTLTPGGVVFATEGHHVADDPSNLFWDNANKRLGIGITPSAILHLGTVTEDLEIVDAGSAGATEQDWIEVQVGDIAGFIRVFATK